ncbi:MAG: retron system putative HNH endonuclease [Candidatus Hatepunaea meridiana]|nr:retron system putative HNH endonuclease [Candidatus Hatepunaea meridiana]
MIRVTREPEPNILRKKADEWLLKLNNASTKKEVRLAKNKYKSKSIKKVLVKMFEGKCAYCESDMTHIEYGHVEHYRPTSKFPELTFEWSNLLLACGVCNGSANKGEKFPEANVGGPIVNPCNDDPDYHFKFVYDKTAHLASVYGITERGELTENLLGLNRNELREHRSNMIKRIAYIAKKSLTDPQAKEIIEEAVKDNAEYAAFTRTLIRQYPHLMEESNPN